MDGWQYSLSVTSISVSLTGFVLRIEKIEQSVKIMKVIINYIVLPAESVTGNFINIDSISAGNIDLV
jgi:hypothetical protein